MCAVRYYAMITNSTGNKNHFNCSIDLYTRNICATAHVDYTAAPRMRMLRTFPFLLFLESTLGANKAVQ